MRILFFIDNLGPGGKQRRLLELIKGLNQFENINLFLVLTEKKIVYTDVFRQNIEIFYTIRNGKKDPKVFFNLFKISKKIKPDLIHVWGNLEAIYALPIKIFQRVPLLNGQITNASDNLSNLILNHKITFPFSDIIIGNSNAGLKVYNAPKIKSKVIYNGFDFERISNLTDSERLKTKYNIETDYVVGMAASFDKRKDYHTFMEAINIILSKTKKVTFLCVGDGDFTEYRENLIENYKDNVLFLSHQKKIESLMNICDIGVLSTFTEGISNSILEFMALGKPVVVTGSGGCSELIEHERNGYLFEIGNFESLAKGIINLLEDKKKRLNFGKRSQEIVREKFSIKNMTQSFYEEYKNLLG